MATGNQRAVVRRSASLVADDAVYTDELLSDLIDTGSVNKAILQVWREKAAALAEVATVSEAGSSRSLGELHDNALEMIKIYQGLVNQEDASAGSVGVRPFSVPIVRG